MQSVPTEVKLLRCGRKLIEAKSIIASLGAPLLV